MSDNKAMGTQRQTVLEVACIRVSVTMGRVAGVGLLLGQEASSLLITAVT